MAGIKNHEELRAWQLSEELKDRIFEFTKRSGVVRDRDFVADIRRSGRSAPANLAEGFSRFRPRENAKAVRVALGELGETKNHLTHALKQDYISRQEFEEMHRLARRALGAASKWHNYLMSCNPNGPWHTERQGPPETGNPDA